MRRFLLISLAFAAGVAVLTARGDDTPAAAPRPERPVLTGTAADVPKLQRAVRRATTSCARRRLPAARPLDRRPLLLRARRRHPRHAHARGACHRRRDRVARHDFRQALALGGALVTGGRSASTRWSSSAATTTRRANCRRCSTANRTSPATPAPPICARKLHGDLDGAVEAMRLALNAGGPAARTAPTSAPCWGSRAAARSARRRSARVPAGARAGARPPGRGARPGAARR